MDLAAPEVGAVVEDETSSNNANSPQVSLVCTHATCINFRLLQGATYPTKTHQIVGTACARKYVQRGPPGKGFSASTGV